MAVRKTEVSCAICLEGFASAHDVVPLPCRHCFHENCVDELRASPAPNLCPVCRTELPEAAEVVRRRQAAYAQLVELVDTAVDDRIVTEMERDMLCRLMAREDPRVLAAHTTYYGSHTAEMGTHVTDKTLIGTLRALASEEMSRRN